MSGVPLVVSPPPLLGSPPPLLVSLSNHKLRVSGFFSSVLKRFPHLARGRHE